jgi:hypothetical protein
LLVVVGYPDGAAERDAKIIVDDDIVIAQLAVHRLLSLSVIICLAVFEGLVVFVWMRGSASAATGQ